MRYFEYTPTGTRYSLCLSEKQYAKVMDKMQVPVEKRLPFVGYGKDATTHSIQTTAGVCCIVCIGDIEGCSKDEIYGLILHECVHIWQTIKEWMREERPGDEIEAYSIQSIFMNMLSVWKHKK